MLINYVSQIKWWKLAGNWVARSATCSCGNNDTSGIPRITDYPGLDAYISAVRRSSQASLQILFSPAFRG